jgi:hypothetical protein
MTTPSLIPSAPTVTPLPRFTAFWQKYRGAVLVQNLHAFNFSTNFFSSLASFGVIVNMQ